MYHNKTEKLIRNNLYSKAHYKRINLSVKPDLYDAIKAQAAAHNKTTGLFIVDTVKEKIQYR